MVMTRRAKAAAAAGARGSPAANGSRRSTPKAASGSSSKPRNPSRPGSLWEADEDDKPTRNSDDDETEALLVRVGNVMPWALVLVATAVAIAQTGYDLTIGDPADTKPYGSFQQFYPFYLTEHTLQWTKRLHAVGTSFSVGYMAWQHKSMFVAAAMAASIGLITTPMLRSLPTGAVEGALMVATFVQVSKYLTGSYKPALIVSLCGYGPAWVAHFFVELNKPASWIYPVYSLCGDFVMLLQMLTGKLAL